MPIRIADHDAMPTLKKSPPELIERFSAALPAHPGLVRKPMFGYPAAFVQGNMVCSLFRDSVVVRLGKNGAAEAVAAGKAAQFAPTPGRAMTGYVVIPDADVQGPEALSAWLQRALDFTLTLPAKVASNAGRHG
ncbi:TfoX/Sxy family protein [Caenimonas terrae]|uniref:TfoX/Sxy family protein n=1 Tax=Caenimonas terrae TaxID=696074 RepID=A0ABW0NFA1_9BURK